MGSLSTKTMWLPLRRILRSSISSGSLAQRCCSTSTTEAKAVPDAKESSQTFASLMRNSKFVQMGNPEGKVVVGKIYHVVEDDLYIDWGGKFPCVCQRPRRGKSHLFTRGAQVRVLIKKTEMSQKFLGF